MLANGAGSAISNVRQARSSSASVTFHTPISSAASRGARAASLVEFGMPGQTPKAGICVNSDEGGAGQKARQILQVWGSETESSLTSSRWGQDCSLNVENRGLNPNLGRKKFWVVCLQALTALRCKHGLPLPRLARVSIRARSAVNEHPGATGSTG